MSRLGRTKIERIADKVALTDDGCLEWLGAVDGGGYGSLAVGSIRDGSRTCAKTHRVVYEAAVGPIPAGLELDHLCRNRRCCMPDHLEPVTHRENARRGISPAAQCMARNTCAQGHEYTEANTYIYHGKRVCRKCKAAVQRRRYRRLKEARNG